MEGDSSDPSVAGMMKNFHQYLVDTAKQSASSKDFSGYLLDTSATLQLPNINTISRTEHEKQLRNKDAELVSTKTTVLNLKRQLSSLEVSRKRVKIEQGRDLENVKQELQKSCSKMEEMRAEKIKMMKKVEELHDDLDLFKKSLVETKTSCQKKLAIIQKEKNQMSEELKELSTGTHARMFELKKENMTLQAELSEFQSQLKQAQELLQNATRKATGLDKVTQELGVANMEKLQAEQRVKELEEKLSSVEEDVIILKSKKEKLNRMPEIERENRRLLEENQYYKDTTENVQLLKEKVTSLKQKLERYEKRLAGIPILEMENEEMKTQVQKWEACFRSVGVNKQSPEELARMIDELQSGQLLLLEKHGHLQTSSKLLEQSVHKLEHEEMSYKHQISQEKEKNAGQADLIKRLQRKLLLVTKERDAFREIIQTYENEVTLSITAPLTSQGKQPNMKELDNLMIGYQKQVSLMEVELEKATKQAALYMNQAQQLEDQLNTSQRHEMNVPSVTSIAQADQKIMINLREKVAQLEQTVAKLTEEKDILEARIEQRNLQGDYDPTRTKVLHFTMNPAAHAQKMRSEELKQLKEENDKLKKRIDVLEESGGEVQDLTARVHQKMEEEPAPSKELEEAKAQLNSAELKNKRLVEAFKQTSRELREGCFQLTGYRIDMPVTNQFKLMNIYAESADDFLQFQRASNGELNLLETEYSTSLTDLAEMYLSQGNSIPAFLSALTLELFNKQTILM